MTASAMALFAALGGCDTHTTFRDADPVTDATDVRADSGSTVPGAACATDPSGEATTGCSSGQTCLSPQQGFPAGYCAPDCLRTACPSGSECYPVDGAHRYCVRLCTTDGDCRARDGYTCQLPAPGAQPACLPDREPVGHRDDGRACYASGGGDGGVAGPYLAPLPRVTFTSATVSASRRRIGTAVEAQPSLALGHGDPADAWLTFAGISSDNYGIGGLGHLSPTGDVLSTRALTDADYNNVSEPSVMLAQSERIFVVDLGFTEDRPGYPIRFTDTDDRGATLARTASVFGADICNDGCFAPDGALGPDTTPTVDNVYAVGLAHQSSGGVHLVFARTTASDAHFGATTVLATDSSTVDDHRAPAAVSVSADGEPGRVDVAWIETTASNGLSFLGDARNVVRMRASTDGGRTFATALDVSHAGDAPVPQPPALARGAGWLHALYVRGGALGAWDVILASSHDEGASWQYRVVNDDPDRCATHAFVALAVDPANGDAHALWLENRFGPGMVAYAHCPADPSERCGRNEVVSDAPFLFTTADDPFRWHGTHSALVLARDGTLWAAWSDTRTGVPGVYLTQGHR